MPQRQVFVIDPVTGISRHTYINLGAGAAKPNHGQPGNARRGAVGPAGFVRQSIAISSHTTKPATTSEDR